MSFSSTWRYFILVRVCKDTNYHMMICRLFAMPVGLLRDVHVLMFLPTRIHQMRLVVPIYVRNALSRMHFTLFAAVGPLFRSGSGNQSDFTPYIETFSLWQWLYNTPDSVITFVCNLFLYRDVEKNKVVYFNVIVLK